MEEKKSMAGDSDYGGVSSTPIINIESA